MLSSVEQAFVGREEIRAPLKTPAWEAKVRYVLAKQETCTSGGAGLKKGKYNRLYQIYPLKGLQKRMQSEYVAK